MVSALILLPLLLTLFASSFGISHVLLTKTQSESNCYRIVLSAQKQLKKHLRLIISLNGKARRYRSKKTVLKRKLLAASLKGNYALMTYYQIEISKVIKLQMSLDRRQKAIFRGAERTLNKYKSKLKNELNAYKLTIPKPAISVLALQKNEIAPEYKLKENFRSEQAIRVAANSSLKHILDQYITLPKRISFNCGGSLKPKGRTWVTVLEAGK